MNSIVSAVSIEYVVSKSASDITNGGENVFTCLFWDNESVFACNLRYSSMVFFYPYNLKTGRRFLIDTYISIGDGLSIVNK